MIEKIKGIRYLIWGLLGVVGAIFGMTDAIFYNIIIFPTIGFLTYIFFPEKYLKMIGSLLGVNYIVSVVVFFFGIQGNFIGALLTGLIYTGLYLALSSLGMAMVYFFKRLINQEISNSKRTFSGLIATGALVFIIQISLSILGNPVVATRAATAIEEYIEQKFEHNSLMVGRVRYDRKTSEYISRVTSEVEIDLSFDVVYVNGKGVISDTYERDVLRFRNTINRFANEYTLLIQNLMEQELSLKNNRSKVWYDLDSIELNPEALSLGMEFSIDLPLSVGILLEFQINSDSREEIAEIIENAHALFVENNYLFDSYSISVTSPKFEITIEGITPGDIVNGNFRNIMENELEENSHSHITIEYSTR